MYQKMDEPDRRADGPATAGAQWVPLPAEHNAHERLEDYAVLLKAVLEVDGVPAAVQLANAATAHRFTGVYRFDDEWLTNLYLCDGESGAVTVSTGAPLYETYCQHILQSGHAFTVLDSLEDDRLAGHPKRADVRSYCGAPLLNQRGEVAGTVCHFDADPDKLGAADFEQVHITAAVLQERVLADAGPTADA